MEEDIKVLERVCKARKFDGIYTTNEAIFEAIENLIARNKELEEMNKKLESRKYMLNAETGEVTAIPIDNNYIPKSKVREKIEEYEELVKDFEEYWSKDPRQFKKEKCVDYYKIEALEELLQEGDK